jgi:hypothetical protein
VSQARAISELLGMGAENARVVLEAFTNAFGKQGTRQLLESAVPPRSPIQDAMRQEGALRMGVRELPVIPGQAPKPEFGAGSATRQPEAIFKGDAPAASIRPVGATETYTVRRGDPTPAVRQDVPPAPRAAERFEAEGQLRIPFTQPGKGGRMYSPMGSAENPEVAGAMMRSRLGDLQTSDKGLFGVDVGDFPRYRGVEGQQDIPDPNVTRAMMRQMAPGMPMEAPPLGPTGQQLLEGASLPQGTLGRIQSATRSAGVNQVDLSNPMVRAAIFSAGIGAMAPLMNQGGDGVPTPMDSGADLPESIEQGAATGAVEATGETDPIQLEVDRFVQEQPMGAEAAAVDEQISRATTAMQQAPGEAGAKARAMAPRDPSTYKNIADYYADRKRFVDAMAGGEFKEKLEGAVAEATPSMTEKQIEAFVKSQPALAYELMMRGMGQRPNPMMSEQTAESITTQTVGSSLGDDNLANATGQAMAAAANVSTEQMAGTLEGAAAAQQNNEIIDASRPILRPQLQRTEEFVDQQFRPRMAGGTGFFRQMRR